MEEYFEKQKALQPRIKNAFDNFKSKGPTNMTTGAARARLQGLEEYFLIFKETHDSIMLLDKLDKKHLYFTTKLYDLVEDSYFDSKGLFLDFIKKQDVAAAASTEANAAPRLDLDALIKLSFAQSLPQLDIPKFSGKHAEWSNFKELFRGTINKRDDLTPVMKFYHLRALLTGEALDKIKTIKASDATYNEAWTLLNSYYENKRRLVDSHLSDFASVKPMKAESSAELKRLFKESMGPLSSLKSLDQPVDSWGALLVFFTVSKFECSTRKDWERHLGDSVDTPTWTQLKSFINAQILTLEAVERGVKTTQSSPNKSQFSSNKGPKGSTPASVHALQTAPKNNNRGGESVCSFCKQAHYIATCGSFKSKSLSEKRDFVNRESLCFNCLGKHSVQACRSPRRCIICKGKHHTTLHSESKPSVQSSSSETTPTGLNSNANEFAMPNTHATHLSLPSAHLSGSERFSFTRVLLATARIYVEAPNGSQVLVRALVDQCSQVSIVSQSLCQRLRLKYTPIHAPITCVGSNTAAISRESVTFTVRPRFRSSFLCEVHALVLPRISSYAPPSIQGSLNLRHLEGLELADPNYLDSGHIDVLLGASVHARIMEGRIVRGQKEEPIASLSTLGWLISGDCSSHLQPSESSLVAHCTTITPLDELMQKFWQIEELPQKNLYTADEQECEKHFVDTHSRDAGGRYIVRLPLKQSADPSRDLGDSYTAAFRSLQRMENRFGKDDKLRIAYSEFMDEYENLCHMIQASKSMVPKALQDSFFLPHHGVWKESSTTTKLRTVFNGSARTSSGLSLNDLLQAGPNLLPNLIDLICRWRIYQFAFSADIEKMYRQILIHEDDQHLQSILWRSSSDSPVEIFRLRTVTYGLVSSTFLSQRTLKQLAADHQEEFPLGAKVLNEEIYMDDVLSGAHSLEEAKLKQLEIIKLLKVGGFPIRKWSSNEIRIIEWLPAHLLALDPIKFEDKNASLAVLGISWRPSEDSFCFEINCDESDKSATKRSILSSVARIFDPLGWLAPVVIVAKMLMQSLWLLKIGWDENLPPDITENWNVWKNQLPELNRLKLPRWSQFSPDADFIEIHGFADASKQAYAAVIYLRILKGSQVYVTLQLAKTRVAPLKTLSIPRLELCAAHLLAKLVKHFLQITPIEVSSLHLWSDSSDVLYWLRDRPSRWPIFVANRCSEILTLLPNAFWHQVKSKDNPADVASRGIDPTLFQDFILWWKGAEWLRLDLAPWPTSQSGSVADNPVHAKVVNISSLSCNFKSDDQFSINQCSSQAENHSELWSLMNRFSSLSKLLRVTAYCLKFVTRLLGKANRTMRARSRLLEARIIDLSAPQAFDLSVKELNRAKLLWVFLLQNEHYSAEIKALRAAQPLPKRSPLLRLNPILINGLLRVGGRLRHALLEESAKHPLILPSKNHFTNLLIQQTHLLTLHGGVQLTLITLRNQYWLISARQAVKTTLYKCLTCIRYSGKPGCQLMGELPEARVLPSFPFQRAGVDYAGPFNVRLSKTRGKGTTKGYIAIFVCMSTRAVHLEIVEDYTSEAFVNAFHRFTARRGHCSEMFSDKGTNFVGADKQLRKLFSETSSHNEQIFNALSDLSTSWNFNPPSAPHFGGLWEAAVKSVKRHLRRIVGDQVLTFLEYSTLLCRIEACLNSRPLTPLTDDNSDLQPLTPAHFLIQRCSFLVPEPDLSTSRMTLGKRWELVSQLVQQIWRRWSTDYLTALQVRQKWQSPTRQFCPGDLVLIRSEIHPPGLWPLGRIIQVHPGVDGLVRVATIRTSTTTLKRPIVKLILIPTDL